MKPRVKIRGGQPVFQVVRLSDKSQSALHWSVEEMLTSATAWAADHPEMTKAIVIFAETGGRGQEDDRFVFHSEQAGMADLELNMAHKYA